MNGIDALFWNGKPTESARINGSYVYKLPLVPANIQINLYGRNGNYSMIDNIFPSERIVYKYLTYSQVGRALSQDSIRSYVNRYYPETSDMHEITYEYVNDTLNSENLIINMYFRNDVNYYKELKLSYYNGTYTTFSNVIYNKSLSESGYSLPDVPENLPKYKKANNYWYLDDGTVITNTTNLTNMSWEATARPKYLGYNIIKFYNKSGSLIANDLYIYEGMTTLREAGLTSLPQGLNFYDKYNNKITLDTKISNLVLTFDSSVVRLEEKVEATLRFGVTGANSGEFITIKEVNTLLPAVLGDITTVPSRDEAFNTMLEGYNNERSYLNSVIYINNENAKWCWKGTTSEVNSDTTIPYNRSSYDLEMKFDLAYLVEFRLSVPGSSSNYVFKQLYKKPGPWKTEDSPLYGSTLSSMGGYTASADGYNVWKESGVESSTYNDISTFSVTKKGTTASIFFNKCYVISYFAPTISHSNTSNANSTATKLKNYINSKYADYDIVD